MHTHKISYYHKIQKTKENLEKGEYKKIKSKVTYNIRIADLLLMNSINKKTAIISYNLKLPPSLIIGNC